MADLSLGGGGGGIAAVGIEIDVPIDSVWRASVFMGIWVCRGSDSADVKL